MSDRMQDISGMTAIPLGKLHHDIVSDLILKGEFNLLDNTTHLDEIFKISENSEITKMAIDTFASFTHELEQLKCSLTFFGYKQGGYFENGKLKGKDWSNILSTDKKQFLKPPVVTFLFALQSDIYRNKSFEVSYKMPIDYPLLALANMTSEIWLTAFFSEDQPIPWEYIKKVAKGL
jgi:hypothetical protein